jgi:hypothetical protein
MPYGSSASTSRMRGIDGAWPMFILREVVYMVCAHPELSGRNLAGRLGVLAETVLRYRKMVKQKQLQWSDLEPLSDEDLYAVFNRPRYRKPKKTVPDMARVEAVLNQPGTNIRDAWEDYRANLPGPHLCLSTFRDFVRAHWRRSFARTLPMAAPCVAASDPVMAGPSPGPR